LYHDDILASILLGRSTANKMLCFPPGLRLPPRELLLTDDLRWLLISDYGPFLLLLFYEILFLRYAGNSRPIWWPKITRRLYIILDNWLLTICHRFRIYKYLEINTLYLYLIRHYS
jgi:hypothetical protein